MQNYSRTSRRGRPYQPNFRRPATRNVKRTKPKPQKDGTSDNKKYLKMKIQKTSKAQWDFVIVTWNVEGKGTPAEVDKAIMKECSTAPPDIICLQEANLPKSDEGTENYKWYCTGDFGTAILIKKSPDNITVSAIEQVCPQLTIADVVNGENKIKIISCLVPPSTNYLSDDLWSKLTEVLKTMPTGMMFIIAGDLNAQVAKVNEKGVEAYNFGQSLFHDSTNENGVKLKNLARTGHLRVCSTFNSKDSASQSFTLNDNGKKSQQDYILVPRSRHSVSIKFVLKYWVSGYKHSILGTQVKIFEQGGKSDDTKESVVKEEKPDVEQGKEANQEEKKLGAEEVKMEVENDNPEKKLGDGDEKMEVETSALRVKANARLSRLSVSTWNIHGATPAKVDAILNEHKIPMACVQELFLTSDEDIKTENYTWFSSKQQWAKNVGILVKNLPEISASNFEVLSDCICVLDILFYGTNIKVISCFMPPVSDLRHISVRAKLTEFVKSIPEDTFFVIGGDFNSNLGSTDQNDNKFFLQKLAEENNLALESTLWKEYVRQRFIMTNHITATSFGRPHQLLIPLSKRKTVHTSIYVRWIPFFENAIVILYMQEHDTKTEADKETNKNSKAVEHEPGVTVVEINKVRHKTRVLENKHFDLENLVEPEPLTSDVVEKFKSTAPSAEEMQSFFSDFVLLFGVNAKGSGIAGNPIAMITTSFTEAGKFGTFTVEDDEATWRSDEGRNMFLRSLRIKWNGIILEEVSTDSKVRAVSYKMKRNLFHSLVVKLSQICYTIKTRKTFYNKGHEPIKFDALSEAGLISEAEKQDLLTLEAIKTHIDEYFVEHPESELFFGPDFSKEDREEITKYAKEKKLGFRFFTSSKSPHPGDHVALFKKQTPQFIRDKLLISNTDHRFYLVPPCGIGKNYREFSATYGAELKKEEDDIFSKFWAPIEGEKIKKTPDKGAKTTPAVGNKPKVTPKVNPSLNKARQQNNHNQKGSFQTPANENRQTRRKRPRPQSQRAPVPLMSVSVGNRRDRGQQGVFKRERLNEGERMNQYRYETNQLDSSYRSEESYRWLNEHNGGRQYPEVQFDLERNGGRQYPEAQYDQYEQLKRERDGYIDRLMEKPYYESEYPMAKRARLSDPGPSARAPGPAPSRLPQVKMPQWGQVAPLIIVWPVTVRSEIEERPKQVLEANFPIDFEQGSRGEVAVFVSLPMRNGTEKKFCMAIERDHSRASRIALDVIVKHSSVIKPNASYLCNGAVPNFVRYKVPCQTHPRTYIILSKANTGPLLRDKIQEIFETFRVSYNEEVFFDRDSYTRDEKLSLIDTAPKFGLKVRHFGDSYGINDRYVCVFKNKPKEELLEEVLKMRGAHPKYTLTTDRLPTRLGYNIF